VLGAKPPVAGVPPDPWTTPPVACSPPVLGTPPEAVAVPPVPPGLLGSSVPHPSNNPPAKRLIRTIFVCVVRDMHSPIEIRRERPTGFSGQIGRRTVSVPFFSKWPCTAKPVGTIGTAERRSSSLASVSAGGPGQG
jgi:hypothetical protein